jgi:WD40-like Beta Propeller Repeat
MRALAVSVVLVAALAATGALMDGAAAASQRAAKAALQDAASPSWSPDGKQIVFTYVRYAPTSCCGLQPSRYRIVRTASKPGGAVRTVLPPSVLRYDSPLWIGGGRLLFGFDGRLTSVSVRGGKAKRVAFPDCHALSRCYESNVILSPNGKIAAVTTCDCGDPHPSPGIGLVKLNRARPVLLTTPLTAQEQDASIFDKILAFSPGGEQLVFSRAPWDEWDGPGTSVLMAMRLSGGDPVPLTQSGIPGASLVPSDAQQAQWSPDGRWVAFVRNQSLEVVPTTGGAAPRVLASDFGPCAFPGDGFSWSPTSKAIAYDGCPNQGNPQLMTVRPNGTHPTDPLRGRRLTLVTVYERGPQWSPDGSRLLFTAHRIGHRTVHVWTIRASGRDLTRLG